MTDIEVPKGGRVVLGAVDGNLTAGKSVRIEAAPGGAVVVAGDATFAGDATLIGEFRCRRFLAKGGRIRAEGAVRASEEFTAEDSAVEIRGALESPQVEVERELRLHADSRVGRLDVGGTLDADGALEGSRLHVGGRVRIAGRTMADELSVGGRAALGVVDLSRFDVGGVGEVGGGTIRDQIHVGGKFSSTAPLVFGRLEVGGTVSLAGGSKGGSIEVGGVIRVSGDLTFDDLEVGGIAEIAGNATGRKVEVGGQFRVDGNLALAEGIEVGGRGTVGGDVTGRDLEVGGEFRARKAVLTGRAEVAGAIRTELGLRALSVEVRRKSHVRGPLVADRVVLGRGSEAELVFGGFVEVGADARVLRIVADEVELGPGATVGRVEYVRTLKVGRGASTDEPPVQIATRPAPPV
jgi:cytoskeletal protein CcmA (bactofilin family)